MYRHFVLRRAAVVSATASILALVPARAQPPGPIPAAAPATSARPSACVVAAAATAKAEHVGVFHRFELMRHWHETAHLPFEAFAV